MKQVTQILKTGEINVEDVPIPTLRDSFLLVKNRASVISAGTEKTKIDMGKKSLIQKAKARPDLVKQVLNKVRTEGLSKTLQTVKTRLTAPSPLGYSSAGEVMAIGGQVSGINPGDRVACAGAGYANHAEFVAVPKNLVVKVPENVTDEEAAFTTLGAIALQGVRLADPKLGEKFLVLGLGLLGQITVQLLRANGCTVFGTDLDGDLVKLSEKFGTQGIMPGADVANYCLESTGGHGVDGVLVCAGTASNQPIELCGKVTRDKGRVVVVGAVGMDIPRENYFKKEISVVISRSYGPGRYDPKYEEGGNDYPYGYVRFTEQRNMEAVLGLISNRMLNVKDLISHRFDLENAADAYKLIEGEKTEPYLGILVNYADSEEYLHEQKNVSVHHKALDKNKTGVSFVGAGNYATATLLPIIKSINGVELRGLMTSSGRTAQGVAKQFGFTYCTSEIDQVFRDDTDVVMIASQHDTHADYVIRALTCGKHVYVEKPLALTVDELSSINNAYNSGDGNQLLVGFNRRFAPLVITVKEFFNGVASPLVVNIRINAGFIPDSHWIQDPNVGGGRIIGEGCHFIDLASALTDSTPSTVYSVGTQKQHKSPILNDNITISVNFDNGSIANITYVADGSKAMSKEYIEVFGGGRSAVINDFKEAVLFEGDTKVTRKKLSAQDKGQNAMLNTWFTSLSTGKPCVEYQSILKTSLATIMIVESMMLGERMVVDTRVLSSPRS